MKLAELTKIYSSACAVCGKTPNEDLLDAWRKQLGQFEAEDLRKALVEWQGDLTEITVFDHVRLRGSTMPSPVDLKSLVLKAQRVRKDEGRFTACGLDGCCDGLKLTFREGRRFAAECWCLQTWKASRQTGAPTLEASKANFDFRNLRVQ